MRNANNVLLRHLDSNYLTRTVNEPLYLLSSLILHPLRSIFATKSSLFVFTCSKLSLHQNLSKLIQWITCKSVTNKQVHSYTINS